ncbi:MAG TPA: patatin-like phospholipase family protein [Thermoanaerobaculia bacterium]|nr:patatin-like phospholipase family protein [Thermoanaerobaculia bacterium]
MQSRLDFLRSAQSVGLVLSGGCSRCSFQVGAIEVLDELGIRPSLCIGVSGGVWNAAAVVGGVSHRLRRYWRCFIRMPHMDLRNLARQDHSPWVFNEVHRRTFGRYVGVERLRRPDAPSLWAGVTRLRDRAPVFFRAQDFEDPLLPLLASNYLPPFFTHAPRIDGERYADGGLSDNVPYLKAFEEGCDAVVVVTMKGESESLGVYRNPTDIDHQIPEAFRDRLVLIRPRHYLPVRFTDRRWPVLLQTMELGRLRAREVLLGEVHPATDQRGEAGLGHRLFKLVNRSYRFVGGAKVS